MPKVIGIKDIPISYLTTYEEIGGNTLDIIPSSITTSGQSYKTFTLVNYESRVVIWGICQSGTTLES